MRYVLITPARNEEARIGQTIRAVVSQTELPHKWIVVDDGSTDKTAAIVDAYAKEHNFIERIAMPPHRDRSFAAKVHCFDAGLSRLKSTEWDVVGNVDADVTFEPDYIQFLLARFRDDPLLGVAG